MAFRMACMVEGAGVVVAVLVDWEDVDADGGGGDVPHGDERSFFTKKGTT